MLCEYRATLLGIWSSVLRGGDAVKEQACSSQQGLERKKRSSWSVFDTESLLQVVLSREMWNGAAGHWLDQAGLAQRHLL